MSFMGGAECSTAGNPLSQFTKHVQDDKSLQRDRLVNRDPLADAHSFHSASQFPSAEEDYQKFLKANPWMDKMQHSAARPLSPESLQLRAGPSSPQPNQAAMEAAFHAPPGTQFSPEDFARFQHMNASQSSRSTPAPSASMAAQQRPMMGMAGMGGMGMNYGFMNRPMYQPMSMYGPQAGLNQQQVEPEGKGKGKVVELDDSQWEEQFAQIELQDKKLREEDESLAMEPELNEMDEKLMHSETGFGDLESIWKGIQAEQAAMKEMDDEESFAKFDSDNYYDWDASNARHGGDPVVEKYLFEEENPYLQSAGKDPFQEGVRLMENGGNLSMAALAFEAAVQKNPDHVEAWVHLGGAQAQNEKEEAAIRALEHALKLDPNNLAALMGLAVSYTNEGYDSTAYRTLERWLSIKYPGIIAPQDLSSAAEMGFTDRAQLHEKVTGLFIKAANLRPDGEAMDPDVQVGLGVLFYGAEEYDKAVDCFTSALHSSELGTSNQRNQLHLLWNRLGATLANSGQSEEAILAYEQALQLHPNFVRARYNLGVSCINIGCHQEAAGHLLSALNMHKEVEKNGREEARELLGGDSGPGSVSDARLDAMTTQNRSTTLYDTLRRVFTQMGRRDLAEKVVFGVDPDIFRGEFDF
ncbi:TPR-like protein [Thozetella sp. PMI_491]|nr:TPR-like protein [Thozetella sp. PMI_491]